LGLPSGSVRAALALQIALLFWLILLFPPGKLVNPQDKLLHVPLFLYFLLGLVLAFFAAHGHTIAPVGSGQPSPWHLPRGVLRVLILLVTVAVVGWRWYSDFDGLRDQLTPPATQLPQWPELLLALAGGYGLGWVSRLGPWRRSPAFQDVQAWVSLLAMLGLGAEVLVHLFINPTLGQALVRPLWEAILTAIVAFYFGVRS
jgi:hypothetical protein